MTCDLYREYELGDLDPQVFADHARQCPVCTRYVQQDRTLTAHIETMKQQSIPSPDLWHRIEQALQQERRKFWRLGFSRWLRVAAVLLCLISAAAFTLWRFDLVPFVPGALSKTRTITRTITPDAYQTLYMNFNQTNVYLSSHGQNHVRIEALFTVTATSEDTVDAWLSRASVLIRPYQDYVRFDLDVPIDTTQAVSIQKAVRILVPEDKALFLGNTGKPIRIEHFQGDIRISQQEGSIEIYESTGALAIQQVGERLTIDGFEGRIEIESEDTPVRVANVDGPVRMTASLKPVRLDRITGDIFVDGINSPIEVTGLSDFPAARRIELATTDSTIVITLPDSAHVFVEATTITGYIMSDYPLYYMNESPSHSRLYLGEGRTQIRLSTWQGNIVIKNPAYAPAYLP